MTRPNTYKEKAWNSTYVRHSRVENMIGRKVTFLGDNSLPYRGHVAGICVGNDCELVVLIQHKSFPNGVGPVAPDKVSERVQENQMSALSKAEGAKYRKSRINQWL